MPKKSLKNVFAEAQPPYNELTMRLLFCTTLVAGSHRYRIRELEIYAQDDPYTHLGDEQVSSCGGWYFHRTKPGGGWKGGTFMGMDISFKPVGTAGGILIRGLSQCNGDDGDNNDDDKKYFDGSCNCVRELLRACGVAAIRDLVDLPNFEWDALTKNGIMRLIEHEPRPTSSQEETNMEWKATSRVGLSDPSKQPQKQQARAQYQLLPLRFLSAPFQTRKEKTKITTSQTGGTFTMEEWKTWNDDNNNNENNENTTKEEDDNNHAPTEAAETNQETRIMEKPQRPKSSYMFFAREMIDKVQQENPRASKGEMARMVSQRYRDLTPRQRQPYDQLAQQDKKRFDEEMLEYFRQQQQQPQPTDNDNEPPPRKKQKNSI